MISTVKRVKEEIGGYRKERLNAKKPYKLKGVNKNIVTSSSSNSVFRHDRTAPLSKRLRLAGRKRSSRLHDEDLGGQSISLDDEGTDFKAKLIGIQDVEEARGDYMCQNAMQACKISLKRSGHRKQRIWFNLSRNGFKIKERTSKIILFNFPINKISFIAKDITDDRAFGFVYEGLEKKKYKFYGIKTEQQAERVVLDIRDLFHVVYEATLKRNQENKSTSFDKHDIERTTELPRKYISLPSTASEVHSMSDQREYEEIPTTYAKILERTKSATEISQVDKVYAESNDLINFNYQTDNTNKDVFDFVSFGTTNQSTNDNLANDFAKSSVMPQITRLDQLSNRVQSANEPSATTFDAFHQLSLKSNNSENPSIPLRSQPIASAILPRPESGHKIPNSSEGKLLPPPLPKRNKTSDQATSQTENKDPFADDFFA